MVLRPIGGKSVPSYRDERTLHVLSQKDPVKYTPVRSRIKGQRPTRLATEFTRFENDQTRMCNWCPQVLGINCNHKFLADRRFIAHLLSKEIVAERHVILNEQEMEERNQMLEIAKKEKEKEKEKEKRKNRSGNGGQAADLLDQMNQMKTEIMETLTEIKSHLENRIDKLS